MSDYLNNLSSNYNIINKLNANTGLEKIKELTGDSDSDEDSFMSILSDYMGNSNNQLINGVVTDKLNTAMNSMDKSSEEYNLVKEAYTYLSGSSAQSNILDGLYGQGISSTESVSDSKTYDNTTNDNQTVDMSGADIDPEELAVTLEDNIDGMIEETIQE